MICTVSRPFKFSFNVLLLKSVSCSLQETTSQLSQRCAVPAELQVFVQCSLSIPLTFLNHSSNVSSNLLFMIKLPAHFPVWLLFSLKCLCCVYGNHSDKKGWGRLFPLSLVQCVTLTALKRTKSSSAVNSTGSNEVNHVDLNHLAFHPYKFQSPHPQFPINSWKNNTWTYMHDPITFSIQIHNLSRFFFFFWSDQGHNPLMDYNEN